jgi:hypothetical protein
MFARIAAAPALWERRALSQQSARAVAPATQLNGATTSWWRHRGGHPVAEQTTGEH